MIFLCFVNDFWDFYHFGFDFPNDFWGFCSNEVSNAFWGSKEIMEKGKKHVWVCKYISAQIKNQSSFLSGTSGHVKGPQNTICSTFDPPLLKEIQS